MHGLEEILIIHSGKTLSVVVQNKKSGEAAAREILQLFPCLLEFLPDPNVYIGYNRWSFVILRGSK